MKENVLSFLRAAAPWISTGLLIAFLCVRPAIRKGKAEGDAVNAVVDRDKAHIVPSDYLHRVADLEIVAPPARQVFHNAHADFAVFHILYHAGIGGAVKKSAAFVIVDIVPGIRQL